MTVPIPYTRAQLERLIAPQSIAIVGASPRAGSFGLRTLENLAHFRGAIWPVNAQVPEDRRARLLSVARGAARQARPGGAGGAARGRRGGAHGSRGGRRRRRGRVRLGLRRDGARRGRRGAAAPGRHRARGAHADARAELHGPGEPRARRRRQLHSRIREDAAHASGRSPSSASPARSATASRRPRSAGLGFRYFFSGGQFLRTWTSPT